MKYFILSIAAFLLLSTSPAFCADHAITQDMIVQKYDAMEAALNRTDDRTKAIYFLHEHIGEKARFQVSVNNPTMPQGTQKQSFELNKQGYINSYIQGANYIKNYTAAIKTLDVAFKDNEQKAVSREIITERGTILNPYDLLDGHPQDFVSRTTCDTVHEIKDGILLSIAASCHTDVSFEETI